MLIDDLQENEAVLFVDKGLYHESNHIRQPVLMFFDYIASVSVLPHLNTTFCNEESRNLDTVKLHFSNNTLSKSHSLNSPTKIHF